ncbi:hypothetical protein WAF17_04280 [Bernardetia sp. ABR2-2B]|uniref:hypothetical protein n=1 Tax=Bernardetia sp. ABR2-2B TaxID=3127472 RepID=UPI0030CAA573
MPYHTHKLNSSHSHIIGRTDPITGDSVKENDNVVFCAVCKSCFLEDSWVYMNERHCEQSFTLEVVPALASRLIAQNKNTEVIAELIKDKIDFRFSAVVTLLSLVMLLVFFTTKGTNLTYGADLIWIASVVSITSLIFSSTKTFKKLTGSDSNDIRIFKNRIEIGKDSFSWSNVKQIKFQRRIVIYNTQLGNQIASNSSVLLLYFSNEKFLKTELSVISNKQGKKLLEALEEVSHFTEVLFYSESWEEFQTMKEIKSKSKGNIKIRKPKKVFDANVRPVYPRLYS